MIFKFWKNFSKSIVICASLLICCSLLNCKNGYDADYLHIYLYDTSPQKKKVRLKDLHDKVVVLDFWATWCEPCKKAGPVVQKLKERSNPNLTVFYGINADSNKTLEEIQNAALDFGMKYEHLLDPNMELTNALNIDGFPALLSLDRKGRLVHKQYGVSSTELSELLLKLHEWESE
jgi:thiol-disulfide isomerase/thioredoxin